MTDSTTASATALRRRSTRSTIVCSSCSRSACMWSLRSRRSSARSVQSAIRARAQELDIAESAPDRHRGRAGRVDLPTDMLASRTTKLRSRGIALELERRRSRSSAVTAMGLMLGRTFRELGHECPRGIGTTPSPEGPPLGRRGGDLGAIATRSRSSKRSARGSADALLLDVTSIKQAPLAAMMHATRATCRHHPMFGPACTPSGQRVVLCRGRGIRGSSGSPRTSRRAAW